MGFSSLPLRARGRRAGGAQHGGASMCRAKIGTPLARYRPRQEHPGILHGASSRAPHIALAAATEQVRSGNLSPADADKLFDELLRQGTPVPERSLNNFLAALARAQPSAACSDGPTLAINLVSRMSHGAGPGVMPAPVVTYGILTDCCCRSSRPDLVLSIFGRVLRLGLWLSVFPYNNLLKGLCKAKRTEQALDLLLHRTPDLGCAPDACSLNILLKSFCDNKRSQKALELLQMMAVGGDCSPNVVAYSTVIHGFFKEGEVAKACGLFLEMIQRGIEPNVNSIAPDHIVFNIMIKAYACRGLMDEAMIMFEEMWQLGLPRIK
ncbi:hypothetical protein QOZ80_4AG0321840 [Eleusine coracana subsp. coracana]|nr:hypothetical protein QOZ80_4AG0321840 [Eleusine coracana subsp. coracana]